MSRGNKIVGSYPNPNIPNDQKNRGYILDYIKAAYYAYINDDQYGYSSRAKKIRNKKYRLSEEDISIYKNRMNVSGDTAYMNLDFSPVSVIPKFVDTVVNSILDKGFQITVTARDAITSGKKEEARNELTGQMLSRDFRAMLSEMMGSDYTQPDAPTSEEEVDLRMNTLYRDDMESALEQGIREIRRINRAKELDRYVLDDLVTCAEGVKKVYLNKHGSIVEEYIDSVNFIRSFSYTPDNRRLKHAGHITKMTIGELRSRIKMSENYTEDDWEKIAEQVTNRKHGYKAGAATYVNNSSDSSSWYDSIDIDVIEMEFVDFNYDKYEYKDTDYGFQSIHKRSDDYKPSFNSKKERRLVTDSYETVYKGSWIVGTDFVFDYGKLHNISVNSDDMYTANLSYVVYTMYGKSMVQKILPYAEQIQLIHLKIQQLAAKARPNGLVIDVSALENAVSNGQGGYFEPLELTEIFDETGHMFFRGDNEDPDMRRSGPPISEVNLSIRENLASLVDLYNHYSTQIREVSGVNEARDGTNNHPKTLVGVQQQALAASNQATYAIDTALYDIISRTSERTVEFIQDVCRSGNFKSKYEKILGTGTMEIFDRIKDLPLDMVGVDIRFEPTADEKAALERHIEIALSNQEIDLDDVIMIREIENIGLANRAIINKKKKKGEKTAKAMEQQRKIAEEDAAKAMQAELAKLEQSAAIEAKVEISKYEQFARIDIMKEKELAGIKSGLMDKEIQGKISVAQITSQGGMEKQKFLEDRKDGRDKSQKSMESKLVEQRKDRLPVQDFANEGRQNAEDLPSNIGTLDGVEQPKTQ